MVVLLRPLSTHDMARPGARAARRPHTPALAAAGALALALATGVAAQPCGEGDVRPLFFSCR